MVKEIKSRLNVIERTAKNFLYNQVTEEELNRAIMAAKKNNFYLYSRLKIKRRKYQEAKQGALQTGRIEAYREALVELYGVMISIIEEQRGEISGELYVYDKKIRNKALY